MFLSLLVLLLLKIVFFLLCILTIKLIYIHILLLVLRRYFDLAFVISIWYHFWRMEGLSLQGEQSAILQNIWWRLYPFQKTRVNLFFRHVIHKNIETLPPEKLLASFPFSSFFFNFSLQILQKLFMSIRRNNSKRIYVLLIILILKKRRLINWLFHGNIHIYINLHAQIKVWYVCLILEQDMIKKKEKYD